VLNIINSKVFVFVKINNQVFKKIKNVKNSNFNLQTVQSQDFVETK